MATKIIPKHYVVQYLNQFSLFSSFIVALSSIFFTFLTFSCMSDNAINPDPFKIMLSGHSEPCAVFGTPPTVPEILAQNHFFSPPRGEILSQTRSDRLLISDRYIGFTIILILC